MPTSSSQSESPIQTMSRAVETAAGLVEGRSEAIELTYRTLVEVRIGHADPAPQIADVINESGDSLFDLASTYQSLLATAQGTNSHTKRKQRGAYYTPLPLVDHLVERTVLRTYEEFTGPIESFRVCDPAVGVGGFLIRSAHMLAERVRENGKSSHLDSIITNCLHGVDIDPIAVILCRAVLANETSNPIASYELLASKIKVGNALIGATPELIEAGIPSAAFIVKPGDDKAAVSAYKRRNTAERRTSAVTSRHSTDPDPMLSADAWCAAFVWRMHMTDESGEWDAITQRHLDLARTKPGQLPDWMREEIERLKREHSFFHWHLEFPGVIPG
ncbi:MAG: hypothetical protein Phyf2KO_06910 [Phycisphaerales bacterium]